MEITESNSLHDLTKGQKAAFKKVFNDFKDETNASLAAIKFDIEAIRLFKKQCLEGTPSNPSIKTNIETFDKLVSEIYEASEQKYDAIVKLHNELFDGSESDDPIKAQIETLLEEAQTNVSEISSEKKEIEEFYQKVYGKEINGALTEGYKQKFENKIQQMEDHYKAQEVKYKALFEQIKSLLPGATSIGLAKAFEDQKKSYNTPIIIWSIVFVVTMTGMLSFGIYYILEISKVADLDISKAFIALLNKLPFFIPTIWLAVFASKQQSQFKRLQQEYAFKETFAKSYDGQKTQLEKLDLTDNDSMKILQRLLDSLVTITSENPSATLESDKHNEKAPFMETIDGFFSKKKENGKKAED